MESNPPTTGIASNGTRRTVPSDLPTVCTPILPGLEQIVGVTGDCRVVGWFERRGYRVKCVARTKECVPVVRILLGFRREGSRNRGKRKR